MESSPDPSLIGVTGYGMASSLGWTATAACAAARAGMTRAAELDYFTVYDEAAEELLPVIGHPAAGIKGGFAGSGRMALLGSMALSDLLRENRPEMNDLSRTGCMISLPSRYYREMGDKMESDPTGGALPDVIDDDPALAESKAFYESNLVPKIFDLCGIAARPRRSEVFLEDQAGLATAISRAFQWIEVGELDRCLVGGIDSYLDSEMLELLSRLDLLKTPKNPAGFMPGEASGFFMLERAGGALKKERPLHAVVCPPSVEKDSLHQYSRSPANGRVLARAIERASMASNVSEIKTGLAIGTCNGTPWTALEWGCAQTLVPPHLSESRQWHPAESFGETGAASGALAVCMGIHLFRRKRDHPPGILVWLSSGSGVKGAFYLTNPFFGRG